MDVLVKVLMGIRSQWKNNLKTDPNGSLVVSGRGQTYNCHITISPTLGFRQEENGKWTSFGTDMQYDVIENRIKSELAFRKIQEQAKMRNATLVEEEEDGQQKRMVYHVPVGPKYKLYA